MWAMHSSSHKAAINAASLLTLHNVTIHSAMRWSFQLYPDFWRRIEMEVILPPIKVPAPGQKRRREFGWANNMSGA